MSRGRASLLLLVPLLLLLAPGTALAVSPDVVLSALVRTPVYVEPGTALSSIDEKALRSTVQEARVPVYVAIVSSATCRAGSG